MPALVAVPLAGPAFVNVLRRLWDEGAAIFPLDLRYPDAVRQAVLARIRPTEIWDEKGRRPLPNGEPAADGDAVVLATSGTTATPKGVVLTHDALAYAAEITSQAVDADPQCDTWLCCSPVAHAAGFGMVSRALRTATPLVIHARFEPTDIVASGATLTSLVPTMLRRIDSTMFRLILLGGMGVPDDRPANTVAAYGLTETMGGVVFERQSAPGVQIRIDADSVVAVRSPTLLRGYRTEHGEQDPKDSGGWFRTGDIGTLDADGLLHIQGRADDVIVTGGEKVWPEEVEAVLRRLPEVAEVAVVGRPDPEWGEQVVAVLVPMAGVLPPSLATARAAVKDVLPAWCAPWDIEIVEALPRTPSGKVRRTELRSG